MSPTDASFPLDMGMMPYTLSEPPIFVGKARLIAIEWGTTRKIVQSHPPVYAAVNCEQHKWKDKELEDCST